MKGFEAYPENARFVKEGVHFITAHVVGSNNNFEVRDPRAAREFFARDKANVAWLNAGFEEAMAAKAKALVLVIHADIFKPGFFKPQKRSLHRLLGIQEVRRGADQKGRRVQKAGIADLRRHARL